MRSIDGEVVRRIAFPETVKQHVVQPLSLAYGSTAPLVGKTPSGRREMSRIATEGGRPLAQKAPSALRQRGPRDSNL